MGRKSLLTTLAVLLASIAAQAQEPQLDDLYRQLDNAIAHMDQYDADYRANIEVLRESYPVQGGNYVTHYDRNNHIAEAYRAFNFDSVHYYLAKNVELAVAHHDDFKVKEAKIKLAFLYANAGMYLEAQSLTQDIDKEALPDTLKDDYLCAMQKMYAEAFRSSASPFYRKQYEKLSLDYKAEHFKMLPMHSFRYYMYRQGQLMDAQKHEESLQLNDAWLAHTDTASAQYATVAFFRSLCYQFLGDKKREQEWLIRSAICDVTHSIKDVSSFICLAEFLSAEGDIERSYRYMRKAEEMRDFYNTPLRKLQSASLLSLIDHNYQVMTEKQNHHLKRSIALISLLSLLLLLAIVYVVRQLRQLASARRQLASVNEQLQATNNEVTALNRQLSGSIDDLNGTNSQLSESNNIKEVYIARFLSMCSHYIQKMDTFRNNVLKKAKSGQLSTYLSSQNMEEMKNHDVAELMKDFDQAFLSLFPTFIDDFNALLKPEARTLPKGELLNTELRIFALIRLGITDSQKIADFLHYSVNTVYNYRSKVKNDTVVPREEFEATVRQIGKIG